MKPVEKLSKYGTVKTCKEVHADVVTIVITNGFTENAVTTFDFMKECAACFPNHPIMETCITEKDFAMVVLKKPANQ